MLLEKAVHKADKQKCAKKLIYQCSVGHDPTGWTCHSLFTAEGALAWLYPTKKMLFWLIKSAHESETIASRSSD